MKKYTKYLFTSSILLGAIPLSFISAVTDVDGNTVVDLIGTIQGILGAVIPLIFSLAVIYFIWSTSQYILKEGEKKNEAKGHMIWGIVILFVMISIWGLVAILENTFL